MDLSKFFLEKATELQKQLQNLLEKNSQPVQNTIFQVSTNLDEIQNMGIALPHDLELRVLTLFSRCTPFFEAGVLLQQNSDSWSPLSAFQKGFVLELTSLEKKMCFDFPSLNLVEVKKARSNMIIHDLGLEEYLGNKNINALVFRPHPQYLFLVLSELAGPWLKIQIDKIQTKTLLHLSDYI